MKLTAARDFCRRMGVSLRAGADLMKVLDSETRHGPPRQRDAMRAVRDAAAVGTEMSAAMKTQGKFFPRLLIAMMRVGEATGRMERTLLQLAEHYENQVQLRRNFGRAIAWPAIQLFMAIGVLSLLIWIMGVLTPPGGGEMSDILGFGLRGTTGVLWFWLYVAIFAAAVALTILAFRRNVGGVHNLIPILYKIPVLGSSIQTITLSRFAWTLSLALDAGLNPIPSIRLSLDATDSDYYRSAGKDAEKAIRGGATLSGALQQMELFPDEFITGVEVAEMSGTDAESIDHLAREYDQRARAAMRTLGGIATGIIWLGVAGFLIFLIFRIAGFYLGAIDDAMKEI